MTSRLSIYEQLGGEAGVRQLVDRFYQIMDTLPEATTIRSLHPPDLHSSRDKLFKFLSGWLGGPPLYMNEFGHPRLRARHLFIPIGIAERDQWMLCMTKALAEIPVDEALRISLVSALGQTANHMRNQ